MQKNANSQVVFQLFMKYSFLGVVLSLDIQTVGFCKYCFSHFLFYKHNYSEAHEE